MENIFTMVDGSGIIELEIPSYMVDVCYHQGVCDYDVEGALDDPCIRKQFDKISNKRLIESLSEVWDDAEEIRNSDRHTNEMRALWIACGNIADEQIAETT